MRIRQTLVQDAYTSSLKHRITQRGHGFGFVWAAGPGQLTVGARLLAPVVAGRGSSAGRKLFDAVLPHAPQKGCLGPLVVTRAAQLTDSTSAVRTPAPSVEVVGVRG